MGTAAVHVDEESLVREKIAELELPAGVKFKRVEQMKDWTGEPGLRIYFSVSRRRPTTPKHIRELSAMTNRLQESILGLGLGKFPFIKLEDAK